MQDQKNTGCCPLLDTTLWEGKEITWNEKLFAEDHVRSIFHIPLNFGTVIKRCMKKIDAAGAGEDPPICLSDEKSPWGSDLYVSVTKEVPDASMATISGTFLTKVFEGPYKNAPKWAKEMETYIIEKGKEVRKMYFFYTTCPKCAKAYGKNYVVLLAKV
jgi:hypothetical protein